MKTMFFALSLSALTLCNGALAFGTRPKIIYGMDDRQEVRDFDDTIFQQRAQSVAGMVKITDLQRVSGAHGVHFEFDTAKTLDRIINACPEERFADQPVLPSCTGFLVAPDVLVTAGHCVTSEESCRDHVWVFDYLEGTTQIQSKNIYRCREIISRKRTLGIFAKKDYAVIRLDRRSERKPLEYRKSGSVSRGDSVLVIGHPSGLPMKIADNARVNVETPNSFRTDLDTYGGNSGSPVFNTRTGLVEGILVSGAQDFYLDRARNCVSSVQTNPDSARDSKERVHKITKVPGL